MRQPGIYPNVPEAEYFADKAASNSLLKEFYRSAAHALAYLNKKQEPDTPAQMVGKLCDRALLEPHRIKEYSVKPAGMSFSTTEGKEWRKAQGTRPIVPQEDFDNVRWMIDSILKHKSAAELLKTPSIKQASVWAKDPETGLMLKGRPDIWPETEWLADLKTTMDSRYRRWCSDSFTYRYHCQAAFYSFLSHLHGKDRPAFFFITVEKEAPFAVQVYQIANLSMQKGMEENRRLLNEYAQCLAKKDFPSYSTGIVPFEIPDYGLKDQPEDESRVYQLD